jgi:hypothetical protein
MSELGERERINGPTVTLDLPTLRLLKLKATQSGSKKGVFFIVRGLEGVGTSIEAIDDNEGVEKITDSVDNTILASGYIRSPEEVTETEKQYAEGGYLVHEAAVFAAVCPSRHDLLSSILKKIDELKGSKLPRLIVGRYGDSAIISPFSIAAHLDSLSLSQLEIEKLVVLLDEVQDKSQDDKMPLNPHKLVDSGMINPGLIKAYNVKAEDKGEVLFSGDVIEPNFFINALR